jgi:hypothetical protein
LLREDEEYTQPPLESELRSPSQRIIAERISRARNVRASYSELPDLVDLDSMTALGDTSNSHTEETRAARHSQESAAFEPTVRTVGHEM